MNKPTHRRHNPKHLVIGSPPAGVDVAKISQEARYVGSTYHKDIPSFAGPVPRPRPDASLCPRDLTLRQDSIQQWLQTAIMARHFSEQWDNGFPRYLWRRHENVVYEARLIAQGVYKGYPLEPDEEVKGLP